MSQLELPERESIVEKLSGTHAIIFSTHRVIFPAYAVFASISKRARAEELKLRDVILYEPLRGLPAEMGVFVFVMNTFCSRHSVPTSGLIRRHLARLVAKSIF